MFEIKLWLDFGFVELYFKMNHTGKSLSRLVIDELRVDQRGRIIVPCSVPVVNNMVCQGLAFSTQVWQLGSWVALLGNGAFQCLLQ